MFPKVDRGAAESIGQPVNSSTGQFGEALTDYRVDPLTNRRTRSHQPSPFSVADRLLLIADRSVSSL